MFPLHLTHFPLSFVAGFMASKALFAALDVEIFEHIANSPSGLTCVALHAQLPMRATVEVDQLQTLLTSLGALGLLARSFDGVYTNSKGADLFLAKTNMAYDYGDYLRYQIDKQMFPFMSHLNSIMKGEGRTEQKFEDYQSWMSDPAEARLYTESQHSGSIGPAITLARKEEARLSGCRTLLDIGGGSGGFSITLAGRFPELSCVVMDFPEVCKVGEEFLAEAPAEVSSRVDFLPGNALTSDLPKGQDVIILSYLCGSVPGDSLAELYSRCFEALNPGGMLIVHDFMVENSRDGPKLSALWALQHMIFVPGGVGLTPGLVGGLMLEAGLSEVISRDHIPGMTKRVIGVKSSA